MKYYHLNQNIRNPQVKLIDEEGKFIGIIDTSEAIRMAKEKGYDLVEINPKEDPPIAKIMNFGQFKYQMAKNEKKQKPKSFEIKVIKLSVRIGQHDVELKATQAKKLMEKGKKIKVEVFLRGRERMHANLGEEIIKKFIEIIKDYAKIEQPIAKVGNTISAILTKI
ncbi:MAG: translation initiation factor IF-3 [Patescibacteria group bacterium]